MEHVGLPASQHHARRRRRHVWIAPDVVIRNRVMPEEHAVVATEPIAPIVARPTLGNIRRIIIKNEEGRTMLEVPLTIGVIGAALLPVLAAIGALAAIATKCTLVVERDPGVPASNGAPTDPPPALPEG